MNKIQARVALLALFLPLFLNAAHILKNELLNPKASQLIEEIGDELLSKTGIHEYVIVTNDAFPRGSSMFTYVKKYEDNLSKPYVVFVFAPHDKRVGIIPSSDKVKSLYDEQKVKSAAIDVVASKDKNSDEDRYNIGIVQGFSELADQIGEAKGVELTKTLPNETRFIVKILKIVVFAGALLVLWIFFVRPAIARIKNGK
ncbi:MAG TPA: hypothetical protein CFH81_05895 [Sulfurovum sp. UBA12169]|nr:MAG TPA: hypothetical protein CFH81_05895 [Sulfurovum sp. UBA12169]